ncbi:Sugar kinase of the NBD/HSP70 family, may contain an N-terminal HTH domain [Pseudoxanthobacter soli DSM 19599]|uniref:Sugar kinase of the NBD/HSP70 family, may contain an N-terminal HTH domain n=1 Tax=Pseudoxanthobacter soli DSM 19599 TaxID=1123029 RepID=A0A1M7ZP53_9HYPH|nr:ROK family transcriptional regulator [Pseudoxanthobacter soli]SHO66673.1 Sugar kinase of the NBD/HSP70 family, may contain an N-terminal HTH domain [Pseudoxanthobacter soli DSM 19599]
MLQATNVVKAKLINVWVVFEAIRIHGPVPRTGIAEITGLSKQATSDLVDELLTLGFVREEKSAERRVGKPPKPIAINPDGAFTIGFHVDYGRLTAIVMNLGGDVLLSQTQPLGEVRAPAVAEILTETAARILREAAGEPLRLDSARFLGVGLATAGPFAVKGINPPRLPGWDGAELVRLLRASSGLPVSLANDGQCAVTAESRFGEAARKLKNFVYVYLGNGLGTGIMLEGAAFGGANGNAGEFGHMISVPGGQPCICGKRGCLETYVSMDSLSRFLAARGIAPGDALAFESRFSPEHPAVAAWIEEAVEPLRIGLNTLENLFDPETVMFGGDAPSWLIEALIERVPPLYPSIARTEREVPRLMKADLGADAVARGAAILPLLAMLNPQYGQLNAFAAREAG